MANSKEFLESITAPKKDNGDFKYNRFNKKNFNGVVTSIINDTDYTLPVAKVKGDELDTVENVEVSKKFRKFIKQQAEQLGVDKAESEKVLSEEYQFKNADGLYELMSAAMIEYLERGNTFDLPTTPNLKASLKVKNVKGSVTTAEAKDPKTKESLGWYETTKEDHEVLKVSSSCPKFLKKRKKVSGK